MSRIRYSKYIPQPLDEIDQRLEEDGQHQKVRRHRTAFNLLQEKVERGSHSRRRRSRKPFRIS